METYSERPRTLPHEDRLDQTFEVIMLVLAAASFAGILLLLNMDSIGICQYVALHLFSIAFPLNLGAAVVTSPSVAGGRLFGGQPLIARIWGTFGGGTLVVVGTFSMLLHVTDAVAFVHLVAGIVFGLGALAMAWVAARRKLSGE